MLHINLVLPRTATVWGLNFNGTRIPPTIARLFRPVQITREPRIRWTLQGACNTPRTVNAMFCQADNGKRLLRAEWRMVGRVLVYAVYVGYRT